MARSCEFSELTKRQAFELAKGRCQICDTDLAIVDAEFHHKQALYLGGDCSLENCMVLCYDCHRGNEASYKRLHPKSPPRQAFLGGRRKLRRIAIVNARNNGH